MEFKYLSIEKKKMQKYFIKLNGTTFKILNILNIKKRLVYDAIRFSTDNYKNL